ncbi:CYTH domain-containing protein [Ideonella alba]|uniref:CYTH domain-containing protein n=1 Tax=Ideonella alba TaxID=2824118 RepID=A0A941BK23_9BURK|nr:CYTH domain-containing protein [Ideonella alba]MBQ0929689.1 CYTH domain-containing protein [Ideonella alba]
MTETELKFQIPVAALPALREELLARGATPQPLRALYLDTPDGRLSAARAALRLRLEGDSGWVQTAKALGADVMTRLEHDAPIGPAPQPPAVDLARHAGTPVAAALQAALQDAVAPLAVVFETDVQRLQLDWPTPSGAWVELALDEGTVRASGRSQPLAEIEFELRSGEPAALLHLAAEAVGRHGLWLDTRSKAERGHLLARGLPATPPRAVPRPAVSVPARAAVARLLEGVLASASVLADPDMTAEAAAPHLSAWLRGLADLLQVLGRAAADEAPPDPAWAETLVALLAPLDAQPMVGAAARVARGERCNRLMLALLGWSQPL